MPVHTTKTRLTPATKAGRCEIFVQVVTVKVKPACAIVKAFQSRPNSPHDGNAGWRARDEISAEAAEKTCVEKEPSSNDAITTDSHA